jgi:hypothetical protein
MCARQKPKIGFTNIYMSKGGKWMKSNKSMNENKKEWINR